MKLSKLTFLSGAAWLAFACPAFGQEAKPEPIVPAKAASQPPADKSADKNSDKSGVPTGKSEVVPSSDKKKPADEPLAPYLLAADDVLSVVVINFPNLSVPQMVVPPDGKITVPLLEPLSVLGKTREEVRDLLIEKWRKYVINPSVTVTLTSKRRENVLFYGFVSRPGTMEYRRSLHILEALAEVGGPQPTGDLSQVGVTHKSGTKRLLDLSHPESKGGTEADVLLEVGDVVYIPERRTQFSVLGEVMRPGSFEYREDMTVLDALTAVGGVKETADLNASMLTHNGKDSKIDLDGLLRHGIMTVNIKMAAGDRLVVPEIRNRTYIFGAVARPGFYIYKPGDRILDALNGSGGPLPDANMSAVNLIHIDNTKNVSKVEKIDVMKFLKKGDMKYNAVLAPGDVVFIPNRKRGVSLSDVFGVLSGLSLVSNVGRIFTGGLGR